MTTQERLARRIDLLSDFQIIVDETDGMIYFHYNRKLDMSLIWLKNLTVPRFTELLDQAQEAYLKFHPNP